MKTYEDLLFKLYHGHDPYAGFDPYRHSGVWYNDPAAARDIFRRTIDAIKPTIIVEVGSFVGESAIFMANHLLERNMQETCILCVDTWLGGFDHWTRAYEKLRFEHGRPTLYQQFLANVMAHGHAGRILPLTLDSINAARLLGTLNIRPSMVYIDASHEEPDVALDLSFYWNLLLPGGAMIVDDANGGFPGVTKGLEAFTLVNNLRVEMDGEKALILKSG